MQIPNTVKELFMPLNRRLFYFESEKYITHNISYVGHEDEQFNDAIALTNSLLESLARFEPKEILEAAKRYLIRIEYVTANLKPPVKESYDYVDSSDIDNTFEIEELPKERALVLLGNFQSELQLYKQCLTDIIKQQELLFSIMGPATTIHEESKEKDSLKQNEKEGLEGKWVVHLSEGFELKKLYPAFQPRLSEVQVVLFLGYLQETKLIPPYDYSSLGQIGKVFFARNNDNLRKKVPFFENYTKTKKQDLEKIQNILQDVLQVINTDLQKFKK